MASRPPHAAARAGSRRAKTTALVVQRPRLGQWIRPLELTVFIETHDDVAGKLTVTAQPGQGAPFTCSSGGRNRYLHKVS
jgi:hypothetical protein